MCTEVRHYETHIGHDLGLTNKSKIEYRYVAFQGLMLLHHYHSGCMVIASESRNKYLFLFIST